MARGLGSVVGLPGSIHSRGLDLEAWAKNKISAQRKRVAEGLRDKAKTYDKASANWASEAADATDNANKKFAQTQQDADNAAQHIRSNVIPYSIGLGVVGGGGGALAADYYRNKENSIIGQWLNQNQSRSDPEGSTKRPRGMTTPNSRKNAGMKKSINSRTQNGVRHVYGGLKKKNEDKSSYNGAGVGAFMSSADGRKLLRYMNQKQQQNWPANPSMSAAREGQWTPGRQERSLLLSNLMNAFPYLVNTGKSIGRVAGSGISAAGRKIGEMKAQQDWANKNYPAYIEAQKDAIRDASYGREYSKSLKKSASARPTMSQRKSSSKFGI
jgi:hypothetical protein